MLTRFEEIKLLALCVTTDSRNAFGRLVEEYEEPLRRFLYNLTGGDACLADANRAEPETAVNREADYPGLTWGTSPFRST